MASLCCGLSLTSPVYSPAQKSAAPAFSVDGQVGLASLVDLDTNVIFYSFDAAPLLALEWDSSLIVAEPKKLGEEIARVFTEMLSKEQGVVTYKFRDRSRTVLYRKSPLTGWWYAFGLVESE